ncbi:MAG: hypothetical protein ABI650_11520 [Dokdonella sp.]
MQKFWLLASLIAVTPMLANAETFDTSFSGDGKAFLTDPTTNYRAVAALPMPNGEVVQVLQTSTFVACPDVVCVAVLRYSAAGAVINSNVPAFGLSSVDAAAIDGSGRVVVVGTIAGGANGRDIAVMRLNADLTLDGTFSGDALATYDFGGTNNFAKAVAIDRRDNIVVVGSTFLSATDSDFLVLRVKSTGTLDTTFNSTGSARLSFDLGSPPLDQANAIAIGNDGRILIGGVALDGTINRLRVAMARLLPNGGYDTTFCADGCSTNAGYNALRDGRTIYYFGANSGHADELFGMDVLGDGGFVIAGATYANDGSDRRGAIARFQSNGVYLGESLQDGLGGNATFRSVRSADAAGSRFMVSATSGPGDVFYSLHAFNAGPGPMLNYGTGNCLPDNSGICFSSSNQLGDIGPNSAGVLSLDSNGRPLFSGDGIANVGDTTRTLITARFTNTTGPKPDRIFRSGFN